MKKQKTGWLAPLVVVFLFLILDMKVSGRNLDLQLSLGFKFMAYCGLLVFYNGFYCARKKPDFKEAVLLFPFAVLILACLLPSILSVPIFLPLILLTLGCECLLVAIGICLQEKKKKSFCTVKTNAAVTGNRKEYLPRQEMGDIPLPTYFPIISFSVEGEVKEVTYDNGLPSPMEVGRRVEILYNPKNPEEFCFPDEKEVRSVRVVPVIFFICGIICCTVGIGLIIW